MPLKSLIRACWLMGVVVACAAADHKPSLIGATREEVLARFGEPKSNIVAGRREVLFFAGERVVLRDERVVEVEEIPIEAPPAPKPAAPAPTTTTATATEPTSADKQSEQNTAAAVPEPSASPSTTSVAENTTAPVHEAQPPAPAAPSVFIKSVRPPGKVTVNTSRTVSTPPQPTVATEPVAKPAPAAVVAEPSPARSEGAVTPAPIEPSARPSPGTSAALSGAENANAVATPATPEPGSAVTPPPASSSSVEATAPEQTVAGGASVSTPTSAAVAPATSTPGATEKHEVSPKVEAAAPLPSVETSAALSGKGYLIGLVGIVVGVGFLIWRRRQRSLLLEATAVSNPPFATPAPVAAATTARFTQELLNKLEWKRFEELVASYYNKTGVVATRTKSGPASAVHIRISWKGEQRPFACVHCVPHPSGLIDAKSVQLLADALAAEDIRRGYVVTAGKFGVPARDLAEEKNITLLSGDLFLEKLNTLPDAARNDLMKDATTGDNVTPSCPTCEAKMTRSPSDPTGWQCPECGAAVPKF